MVFAPCYLSLDAAENEEASLMFHEYLSLLLHKYQTRPL
jgi:hypothetical protein